LIVDLIRPQSVQAYLSMLTPPDRWYRLDEHRIKYHSIQAQLRGIP